MKQKRDRLNDESRLSRFTTHVVLIFASFLAFGPFVWMFLTSIKTYEETIQIPMKFLPEIPQWVNFSIVSDKLNFPQLYLNTILVTIMMIVGQILIVTICAYAFDRLNFPGSGARPDAAGRRGTRTGCGGCGRRRSCGRATCRTNFMLESLQALDRTVFLALNGMHTPYWDSFMY